MRSKSDQFGFPNHFQRGSGLGGTLGNMHRASIRQHGSGLFGHAAAFVIEQAITAGMMPDRYKKPVTVSAYKPPKGKRKQGHIMVFQSPMFGSSALR